MRAHHRSHHYHSHFKQSYPVTSGQKFYSYIVIPLLVIVVVLILAKSAALLPETNLRSFSSLTLFQALGATFLRLCVSYIVAFAVALPLALLANYNKYTTGILLPLFDILASVPVLVFFPILILIFIKIHFFNGAAIFIIAVSMLGNLIFNMVNGLNLIPSDIKSAAIVFKFKKLFYLRTIILPALFPSIVTGSLLAFAEGWNMIIVAEVLHTYIQGGSATNDLFGIGSILVNASASGDKSLFIASVICIIIAVAFLNFFVWQKLLHYAERYKFE